MILEPILKPLSISGDQLSISGGNLLLLPSGSGVSDYSLLTNIPQGIVSGSIQNIRWKWYIKWF